jgi:hypothetical protein
VELSPPDARPLPTWTRTLNDEDARELLDAASPGLSLAQWRELSHGILPQASRARRQELVRIVERDLLDQDGEVIRGSVFLDLFHRGSPHERNTLLFGRLAPHRPLVTAAIDTLVHPALLRADEPLAAYDAAVISEEHWDVFLRGVLPSDTGVEAFKKTRQTVQRFLASVGVLLVEGNTTRTTRVQHARPSPVAFGWLVAHELRTLGRTEAPLGWAVRDSSAARLFAPEPHYGLTCIDAAVAAGVLTRGYLLGDTRLHPGPDPMATSEGPVTAPRPGGR